MADMRKYYSFEMPRNGKIRTSRGDNLVIASAHGAKQIFALNDIEIDEVNVYVANGKSQRITEHEKISSSN